MSQVSARNIAAPATCDRPKVAGVIVTHFPAGDMREQFATLAGQVDKLLIVDNGSSPELRQHISAAAGPVHAEVIELRENRGIGFALNLALKLACEQGCKWLATFDQDSKMTDRMVQDMLHAASEFPDSGRVAVITPVHVERALGISLRPKVCEREGPGWRVLYSTMTSGNLIDVRAAIDAGGYDDAFFIDYVDHEFCLRLRQRGYCILEASNVRLLHRLGEMSVHRIGPARFRVTNHPAVRRYYITRNRLSLWRRYWRAEKHWVRRDVRGFFWETFGILIYEQQRWSKFSMVARGIVDAARGVSGPFNSQCKTDGKNEGGVLLTNEKLRPAENATFVSSGAYACDLALPAEHALIVTVSLFANPEDRSLLRSQIWPVQVLADGIAREVPFFRSWGELGVSSLAFVDPEDPDAPIYFSTGNGLYELSLAGKFVVSCNVAGLGDVHEIVHEAGCVHIANTRNDEVVTYERASGASLRRALDPFRSPSHASAAGGRYVDRFHVNQVFRGLDGDLWALVHHAEGKQFLRAVIGGVIKRQGDGAVINLDQRRTVNLGLSGPHSVRIVGEEYWVMNSGHREIIVYSRDWHRRHAISTAGWGRGLVVQDDVAYGGMSPTRRRYMPFIERPDLGCWVQAFRVSTCEVLAQARILNADQINNIYCVPRALALSLLSL